MPKKQVNAFYFFMRELEPQLKREGRVFPNGLQDVVPIAHPRWRDLDPKEKQRFEKMAKDYKAKMRGTEGDKHRLDTYGNVIAHRKNPYTELEKRRMKEKADIVKDWPPGTELANEQFYFINFQILCMTDEGDYLPCEIAVIEYSIAKGITKKLHRFINPGRIPTGYRFSCVQNSEDTHQIPIENFDLADANYRGLWIQLENFLNPNGDRPEYPPLYCLGAGDNYKTVEYCLEWVHGRACLGTPNRLRKVYELESLFQEMHAHIGRTVSKSGLIDLLTSSEWDYEMGTRCEYHEEKEVKYCALGIIQRNGYAISDNICGFFDVRLTPAHIPMPANHHNITVLPPSSMPVCNNQEARLAKKSDKYTASSSRQQRQQERVEEEQEDYLDLRRPFVATDVPVAGGVKAPSGPAWGSAMAGANGDSFDMMGRGRGQTPPGLEDFPNLSISGRGAPMPQSAPVGRGGMTVSSPGWVGRDRPSQQGDAPPLFNSSMGRGGPSYETDMSSMNMQRPSGVGRGIMALNPSENDSLSGMRMPGQPLVPSAPELSNMSNDYTQLRMPGQNDVEAPPDERNEPEKRPSIIGFGPGRGKGGILDTVMSRKKIEVKGRGFAPPGWVDDGSIGPIRR